MQSISYIAGSNGLANASQMTIQTVRAPGATTNTVNTVAGVPTFFYGSMGQPHTFTDPATGETITIISEATAVDAAFTVNAGKIDIVAIAPGYTDTRGSQVGDIIVVRPITEWANNIANIFKVAHNDDGTLKAVTQSPGWTALTGVPAPTITALGNRSYQKVYNGVDLTTTLSPGMRYRSTRTLAAPTQCTALNGTTQYWSKTSPAGMTFTNFPVATAWVKLSSYNASDSVIQGRFDGTNGWLFAINASGQLYLTGYNGAVGNFNRVISYQSIPLNKWVHVAAQLDMSTATLDATHSWIMIDGVNVPASKLTAGTAPTSLLQGTGAYQVGAFNGANSLFAGKIAQAALFSATVSQTTIQAQVSQGLAGTETSLISAFSFNGVANDLNTTNANNLTANGSAVATNADSPFGGQGDGTISSTLDYGIIQKVTVSGGNSTVIVQMAEGCTIPTTGGVSSISYSSSKVPYGFPGQRDKWLVELVVYGTVNTTGNAAATIYNPGGVNINIPIGSWNTTADLNVIVVPNASTPDLYTALSASSTAITPGSKLNARSTISIASTSSASVLETHKTDNITVAVATPYYVLLKSGGALSSAMVLRGDPGGEMTYVYAENAYI